MPSKVNSDKKSVNFFSYLPEPITCVCGFIRYFMVS